MSVCFGLTDIVLMLVNFSLQVTFLLGDRLRSTAWLEADLSFGTDSILRNQSSFIWLISSCQGKADLDLSRDDRKSSIRSVCSKLRECDFLKFLVELCLTAGSILTEIF